MKKVIFYKTTADFDNTGEVLIYKSLLNFLRPYGEVIVNDGQSIQPKFLSRIGVTDEERLSHHTTLSFIPYMFLTALMGLFKKHEVYFVTGVGEHDISGLKAIIKNLAAFTFLFCLRLTGVKVVRIGMSMRLGGVIECLSERMLSWMFNHYYVRDSISFSNCNKAGVTKCKMAPDLSWGYQSHFRDKGSMRKDVYMSFRYYCETKENSDSYREQLVKAVKLLVPHIADTIDGNVVFCYQCDEDYIFMSEIYEQLSYVKNLKLCNELITFDNAAKFYSKAIYILSNRLHVLLLGYKYGAPTICLSDIEKHRKIHGIFSDNGLQEVLLDIHTPSDKLIAHLSHLSRQISVLENNIRSAEKKNKQVLEDIFQGIFN